MSSQTVARRYALALADAVPREEQRAVQEELIAWEAVTQSNGQLQEVFSNPTIPYQQKRAVLDEVIKLAGVRRLTANFLQTLLMNQRLTELGEINRRFVHVLDELSGVVAAHVITARTVSEDTRKDLQQRLVATTGRDVRLSFATDDALIGGIVTRIGSTVYDGSISSQLERVGEKLLGKE